MALNLPVERDISLIFERAEVTDAFAGHCCSTHFDAESVRECQYCSLLRAILANAIIEWLGLVDQDRVSRGDA